MERKESIAVVLMFVVVILAIVTVNFVLFETIISNVSAVETAIGIGVYWDVNCSSRVDSIDWGVLYPGEVKEVRVYVRNELNESFILVLTTVNWNPENASRHLDFSWSAPALVKVGEVVEVIQVLSVSSHTIGISDFSFDIILEGIVITPDINGDGIVNIMDIAIVAQAYGAKYNETDGMYWHDPPCKYCPHTGDADLNSDEKIDIRDIALVAKHYGEEL